VVSIATGYMRKLPMTLWSDGTAASTEFWAALRGERKCISEDKHVKKKPFTAP